MTEIFRMPDVGEGMHEGDIATWLVKVGDVVKEEDPIAEIQNDKLLQEILSPFGGKVTKLFVEAGTTVEVGAPLIEFDGDGTGSAAGEVVNAPVKETPVEEAVSTQEHSSAEPKTISIIDGQIRAMPTVRRFARQHNIDLTKVVATGRHGNVTLQDVKSFVFEDEEQGVEELQEEHAVEKTVPETTQTVVAEKSGRVPMSPVRKAIAKNMLHQKQNIPHVTLFDQVEVSKLMAHRSAFKEIALKEGIKLTYLAYVAKALAAVNKKFPELNAHVDMKAQEIVYPETINVGIAVDTPNGLFVPVVKKADQKSILAIAKEISELAARARDGKLTPDVASGSSITISNIGSARGSWFTPVINVNESAILGLGTIAKEPIIDKEGEIVVGNMMKLSLSFDHRLIDGMLAQQAMNALKEMLADPAYMLMEV